MMYRIRTNDYRWVVVEFGTSFTLTNDKFIATLFTFKEAKEQLKECNESNIGLTFKIYQI